MALPGEIVWRDSTAAHHDGSRVEKSQECRKIVRRSSLNRPAGRMSQMSEHQRNEDLDMRSSKTYSGLVAKPQLSASFSLQLSSSLALIVSSLNFKASLNSISISCVESSFYPTSCVASPPVSTEIFIFLRIATSVAEERSIWSRPGAGRTLRHTSSAIRRVLCNCVL